MLRRYLAFNPSLLLWKEQMQPAVRAKLPRAGVPACSHPNRVAQNRKASAASCRAAPKRSLHSKTGGERVACSGIPSRTSGLCTKRMLVPSKLYGANGVGAGHGAGYNNHRANLRCWFRQNKRSRLRCLDQRGRRVAVQQKISLCYVGGDKVGMAASVRMPETSSGVMVEYSLPSSPSTGSTSF